MRIAERAGRRHRVRGGDVRDPRLCADTLAGQDVRPGQLGHPVRATLVGGVTALVADA